MGYSPTLGRFISRDPIGTPLVSDSFYMQITDSGISIGGGPTLQYTDGMSLYQAYKSNPIKHVDPTGLLVDLVFDSATGKITARDRDTGEEAEISPGCAFSGGNFNGTQYQSIPKGRYQILERKPNEDGTRADWYILDPFDNKINNDKVDGGPDDGRKNFRFHPGRVSHGCVTVKADQPDCKAEYDAMKALIDKTATETVDYRPGWSTTKIKKFGNMIVE